MFLPQLTSHIDGTFYGIAVNIEDTQLGCMVYKSNFDSGH